MNRFPPAQMVPAAMILTAPAWWLLGLDQAVWLAVGVSLFLVALRGLRMSITLAALVLAFIGVVVVSGVLSAEGSRWITLAREVVIALVFFAAIAGAATYVARRRSLQWLLYGLAAFFAISAAASIAAFLSGDPLTFRTPIAGLVPSVVASTRLGEVSLTERSLGTHSIFIGQLLLRPQGLFLFSTSQAVAAAVAAPLFMAAGDWFPRWRRFFIVVAALTLAMLLLTTTRGAVVALLLASLAVFATRWLISAPTGRRLTRQPLLVVGGVAAAVALLALIALGPLSGVLSERSLESRTELYAATVRVWAQRPLIGWGTEMDPPAGTSTELATDGETEAPPLDDGLGAGGGSAGQSIDPSELPPLGSHSHYLGVLFKQGIVGLAIFAAIIAVFAYRARSLVRHPIAGSDWLLVAVGASLIAAVTESLWLDPGTAVTVGIGWGLLVGAADGVSAAPNAST